jgi:PPOX class probable F420-dependent enzyme
VPEPARLLRGADVLADPLVRELLGKRLVAVLATIGPEGIPHVTPLWFADGGDAVLMATGSGSRKVENLTRDERASLVLHDSKAGFDVCGVSIEGRVEVIAGEQAAPLVERVHARYVESQALEVVEFLASDDLALRLLPELGWTWDQRETPAARAGGGLPLD